MEDGFENVVRFAETDAQGIVFDGNYVEYQDETVTTFVDEVGYRWGGTARDWDIHAVNVELDYRDSPAFRDRLVHDCRVAAICHSSIEFAYRCRRPADERTVVEGSVTHDAVGEDGDPVRVLQDYRDAVADYQADPPEPV